MICLLLRWLDAADFDRSLLRRGAHGVCFGLEGSIEEAFWSRPWDAFPNAEFLIARKGCENLYIVISHRPEKQIFICSFILLIILIPPHHLFTSLFFYTSAHSPGEIVPVHNLHSSTITFPINTSPVHLHLPPLPHIDQPSTLINPTNKSKMSAT